MNYEGPTILEDEAKRQAEEVPDTSTISSISPAQEPSRYAKSASPLVVVNLRGKGKVRETPPSKSKRRRLVKASEKEFKKAKLLASAMPVVEAVEVSLRFCLDVYIFSLDFHAFFFFSNSSAFSFCRPS